jgi:hypothetical protein
MDPAIIVAVIALLGAVLSAGITLYGQVRSTQLARKREAESLLAKYREPLAFAAYELQSRIFNISHKKFLATYYSARPEGDRRRQYAIDHTLYVIAQYFSWTEIIRQQIQFLSFPQQRQTKAYTELRDRIQRLFNSDSRQLGEPFMIWHGDQRAIGELMIEPSDESPRCQGYAHFRNRLKDRPKFSEWFEQLKQDLDAVARQPTERLRKLQHALVDLVRELDPNGLRFPEERMTKLP